MRIFIPLEKLSNGRNRQQMDMLGGRMCNCFT